jgi:hypothetical protein
VTVIGFDAMTEATGRFMMSSYRGVIDSRVKAKAQRKSSFVTTPSKAPSSLQTGIQL